MLTSGDSDPEGKDERTLLLGSLGMTQDHDTWMVDVMKSGIGIGSPGTEDRERSIG